MDCESLLLHGGQINNGETIIFHNNKFIECCFSIVKLIDNTFMETAHALDSVYVDWQSKQ